MCCNGVMFHFVKVQPGDSPKALAALGLNLKRKRKQACFLQPCPAHQDSKCSIYESRPVRCRIFECRQLHLLATETISQEEVSAKISEAKFLVSKVNALLLRFGQNNLNQPLHKRCEAVMAAPVDPDSDQALIGAHRQLADAMDDLDALLDQNFRIELDSVDPSVDGP